jgi:RimJ/RimL family protein N-acetyltransferase
VHELVERGPQLMRPENVSITTLRLDLRLMEPNDARAAFETYTSDPLAAKYMTFATQSSAAEALAYLTLQRKAFEDGVTILWAIRFKDTQPLVGAIELRIRGDEGDIGFIIGRRYWGQGIVPEALTAVTAFARKHLALSRIHGYCDVDNARSARVFEKTGFTSLGIAEKYEVHPQMGRDPRDARRFVLEL